MKVDYRDLYKQTLLDLETQIDNRTYDWKKSYQSFITCLFSARNNYSIFYDVSVDLIRLFDKSDLSVFKDEEFSIEFIHYMLDCASVFESFHFGSFLIKKKYKKMVTYIKKLHEWTSVREQDLIAYNVIIMSFIIRLYTIMGKVTEDVFYKDIAPNLFLVNVQGQLYPKRREFYADLNMKMSMLKKYSNWINDEESMNVFLLYLELSDIDKISLDVFKM